LNEVAYRVKFDIMAATLFAKKFDWMAGSLMLKDPSISRLPIGKALPRESVMPRVLSAEMETVEGTTEVDTLLPLGAGKMGA
jgi:hypothetical protein